MSVKTFFKKNAPVLLTTGSIAFTVGAVITAVKGRPKYDKIITEMKETAKKEDRELTKKEKAFALGKAYGPTALCVVASATCAIVNEKVHKDILAKSIAEKAAEGAAAVAFVENRYKTYRDIAESKLKPKQQEDIKDDIVKRKVDEVFSKMPEGHKIKRGRASGPPEGDRLILDANTGTVSFGDATEVDKAHFNFVKKNFREGMYSDVSLRNWYIDVGIPVDFDNCKVIKNLGWRAGHKALEDLRWVVTTIPNGPYAGEPVWAFSFDNADEPEFIGSDY